MSVVKLKREPDWPAIGILLTALVWTLTLLAALYQLWWIVSAVISVNVGMALMAYLLEPEDDMWKAMFIAGFSLWIVGYLSARGEW